MKQHKVLECLTLEKLYLSQKILTNCSRRMLTNGTLQTVKQKRVFVLLERKINLRNSYSQRFKIGEAGLILQSCPKPSIFYLLSVTSASESKFLLLLTIFAMKFKIEAHGDFRIGVEALVFQREK